MIRERPVFPLPLVLFPGAHQPLHSFEPRYRQLLADSPAGARCFKSGLHAAIERTAP